MNNVLICGYGQIGSRVGQLWLALEASVVAMCRSDPSQKNQAHAGSQFTWITHDLDNSALNQDLSPTDILYYFAPPPKDGVVDTRLAIFLTQLSQQSLTNLKKLVLISTSAVYGNCNGNWVTELSATEPALDRGKRRLDAEKTAISWCDQQAVSLVILRVPGIYGPGRLPIARLKKGLPVLTLSEAPYSNRIHAEDLAQICVRVAETDIEGIFNVCDNEPGNMSQYFFAVADACGLARPPEVDLEQAQQQLSAGMLSYLSESRRMKNDKLLQKTAYEFKYPNLAAGLSGLENDGTITHKTKIDLLLKE